jgi:hypothetical protein
MTYLFAGKDSIGGASLIPGKLEGVQIIGG